MESSNVSSQIHSSTISSPIRDAGNSVASAGTGTASSPFTGFQNAPSSTLFSAVSSPFGQGSNSFGNPNEVAGGNNSMSIPTGASFRGKSARELLTEFYREKNPSKISDVDHVLLKYQGREEEMFRNLAKKYALDPAVFGLSSVPSAIGAMSPPGIAGTPLAFGQPTPLGGGSPFGMAPSATPFGSPPVAFGQTLEVPEQLQWVVLVSGLWQMRRLKLVSEPFHHLKELLVRLLLLVDLHLLVHQDDNRFKSQIV